MAYLKGETSGRGYTSNPKSGTSNRTFIVISTAKTEDGGDIQSVAGIPIYGDQHPRHAFHFADSFTVKQDSKAWWKWTVAVSYKLPDIKSEDPNQTYVNPLNDPPDVTTTTETITIAARGEYDSGGTLTKAIANSAGEPYDPHPEEELDLLVINIARNELPNYSVSLFYDLQNSVNSGSLSFGDATIEAGHARIRLAIGSKQVFVPPGENPTPIYYRRYVYTIVANPLGWDLELLDWGTFYNESSEVKKFIDEQKEFGLLDGSGGKLGDNAAPVYNTWKNKKRANFGQLNLPSGP